MMPIRLRCIRSLAVALVSLWVLALPGPALAAVPTPPFDPSAKITSTTDGITGTATISWHAPIDNGGYPIGVYTITVTPHVAGSPHSTNGTTYSYQMPGFVLGTTYAVSMTATNTNDQTSFATIVHFKAMARPNAPVNVRATFAGMANGHVNMKIEWDGPAHNGGTPITGYSATVTPAAKTCSGAAQECTVIGLDTGSHQQAIVQAKNLVGWSPPSTALSFTVPTVPGTPTGLAATVVSWQGNAATVELAWTAPASNGGTAITGYTATSNSGASKSTAAGTLKCQFTGLQTGTYILSVAAKNGVGSGAKAEIPLVVPAAPTPSPTAAPTATPTPTPTAEPTATPTPAPTTAPPGPTDGSGGGTDPMMIVIGLLVAVVVGLSGALVFFWRKSRVSPGGLAGHGGGGGPF